MGSALLIHHPESHPLADDFVVEDIIGVSPAMRALREDVRRCARFSMSVLIIGPTGTGKEVVARTIHKVSPRCDRPFIPVDCAAITGTLFASQMFGHVKGAFTGATHTTLGCFRAAQGGTVFLDEIGEMELSLQSRLLRVLQQKAVVPVGGYDEIRIDARVIAATNRDLVEEIRSGCFREDLFYRLNVVQLKTPSLVDRKEDVPILASYFLEELTLTYGIPEKRLSEDAMDVLMEYPWPGNVRQLKNLLEKLILWSPDDTINAEEVHACLGTYPLAPAGRTHQETTTSPMDAGVLDAPLVPGVMPGGIPRLGAGSWHSLKEVMRIHIQSTLEHTFNNQSAAAELLGVNRSTLRRMMERLGVESRRSRRGRPRTPR